ncbi:MAG: FKBP-type peptidyl-prolyl cis-trans isomerase [Bacteroidales bacterium]|nr:FKBP-type peptidyl-prolyl cis-trans isomerase [Bacteroidales bacterium]MDD3907026.1 FKBP-type peptidyl-prolyl cis-trans isomerase [Bacteroidales bacterium]MDD4711856.1 FKBP-type peptidyl-prolyl cis-trans isomerase [Bacteroidales bacterium]
MKKIWIYLLAICSIAIAFSSCSENSDDKWRDDNLAFYNRMTKLPNVHAIGDSINGFPGVCYQIIKEGSGKSPIIGNVVNVSYKAWLYNDTISYDAIPELKAKTAFNSSSDYEFTVGSEVIDGWSLATQYMHVGDKWRVFIRYDMGYGNYDNSNVPAYSTLIFDIELKEIVSDN